MKIYVASYYVIPGGGGGTPMYVLHRYVPGMCRRNLSVCFVTILFLSHKQ